MKLTGVVQLLRLLRQLRSHERWSVSQLQVHQADALQQMRTHAYARSSFYRSFHQGVEDRPLAELPILTKKILLANFDGIVTDPTITLEGIRQHVANAAPGQMLHGRYRVSATSGSSGHPGFFVFDDTEWLTVLASFARAHTWAGVDINLTHRMKMASVASTSLWHMSSQVAATLDSWWMPALRLAASEPLESLVQQLNEWQPEMLVAYASMAGILAQEQHAGRLHIHPHLVFTSSEVLTEQTRSCIERAWGVAPFNEYAATEVAGIAAEHIDDRRLHLYEDLLIVESVDSQGRPMPEGEYGAKLLVTSLFGRTLPLIRYEIEDSVCIDPPSPSSHVPFATIKGVQGRTEDILDIRGINGERIVIHPLVIHRVMDTLSVSGWRLIQQPNDDLTVLIAGDASGASDDVIVNALAAAFRASGAQSPAISLKRVDAIPKSASGKSPLIQAKPTSQAPVHS